jgi:hypothetical protein
MRMLELVQCLHILHQLARHCDVLRRCRLHLRDEAVHHTDAVPMHKEQQSCDAVARRRAAQSTAERTAQRALCEPSFLPLVLDRDPSSG